jgi:hypothetical protein
LIGFRLKIKQDHLVPMVRRQLWEGSLLCRPAALERQSRKRDILQIDTTARVLDLNSDDVPIRIRVDNEVRPHFIRVNAGTVR